MSILRPLPVQLMVVMKYLKYIEMDLISLESDLIMMHTIFIMIICRLQE
jgi:hypothetical protein